MLFVRTEHLKTEYYRKKTNLYIIFRIRYTSERTSSDANCISLMNYLHKDAERSSEAERRASEKNHFKADFQRNSSAVLFIQ